MTHSSYQRPSIECRLVLFSAGTMQVLVVPTAEGWHLPHLPLPAASRSAEALSTAVRERFGLVSLQLAMIPDATGSSFCTVHEIIATAEALPCQLSFAALNSIASGKLSDRESAIVFRIMKGEASEFGRFAKPGWLAGMFAKLGKRLNIDHLHMVHHLNCGVNFCLLSMVDSDGRKLWFKSVGEPNICEYAITVELARRFPAYLPKILFTIPEWHGWMMEDVSGCPLSDSCSIHQCSQALAALAFMQQEMADYRNVLSALGANDWSYARIFSLIDSFCEDAHRAMLAQTSNRSKSLAASELIELRRGIEDALDQLNGAGIPETLLHPDLGHGNVIATANGPVFLDWASASIGHPFLSAEQMLSDLTRSAEIFGQSQATLRRGYAMQWRRFTSSMENLDKAAALMPAFAAFVYAMMAWDASRHLPSSKDAWPIVRSMLRRTKRELEVKKELTS